MKPRELNEYDLLKAVAIVLVIVGHVTIGFTPQTYTGQSTRLAQLVTSGIYLFHMPLFMAVSGAVYELSRGKLSYQKFIPFVKVKFKRIIIPYFVVGLCAVLPVLVYTTPGLSWNRFSTWAKILLAEDCRHLWYLLALFWLFVIQYFCDKARCNLWVLFVFACALTLSVSWIAPDFRFMCVTQALRHWPDFILGMIMVRYLNDVSFRKSLISCIIIGGGCVLTILLSHNYYVDMVFSLLLPYFICVALIVSARQLSHLYANRGLVRFFVSYGFGIYLFHMCGIWLAKHFLLGSLEMYTLMGCLFVAALTFSILMTWLLRKLNLGFAIGE